MLFRSHYLTTDAAWLDPRTPAGIGFAIWTHTGYCICAGFDRCGASSAEEAEAGAIRCGLESARSMGIREIAALTDCLNLATILQRKDILTLSMSASTIAHDILHLSRSFDLCNFHFIGRTFNVVAHELAQAGRKYLPFSSCNPAEISSLESLCMSQS